MVPIAGLALLFTRLDGATLLEHDARKRIVGRVERAPGAHIAEIASELSLDPKTVAYHVRQLARAGRLRVERDGRARRCYPPGVRASRPAPGAREHDALWLLRWGASGPAEVARALRVPRGTAGSLLARLVRRGLAVRDGRAFRPAPEPFSGGRDLGET